MLTSLLAIALGAAAGAIARWLLALGLNGLFPTVPPGTLAANVIGGYLVGLAFGVFAQHPEIPPHWRLFIVTGFLGGLTTFSTFSAEVTHLLNQGRLAWALGAISMHVAGSLGATLLGLATAELFKR